jgi:hypothetical protein
VQLVRDEGEPALVDVLVGERQQPLHDRSQANEHHQELQQIRQSTVLRKPVDSPKTDRPDNDNNQNPDQD